MSQRFREEWQAKYKIAMGQRVGGIDDFKFMQETAMVHMDERELVGYCRAFSILFPEVKKFKEFLEDKAIPALIMIGRGRWYRDTITDLSLGLSKQAKDDKAEDVGELLEEE